MGIRFACHHCGKSLNIKSELSGKRGVCPACSGKFRIPLIDTATSLPVDIKQNPERSDAVGQDPIHSESPDPSVAKKADRAPVERAAATVGTQVLAPSPKQVTEALAVFESSASWYVRPPGGGQYGPATKEVFGEWIKEGRVASTSLVWRDGWAQWRSAFEAFPELASQLPGANDAPLGHQESGNHPTAGIEHASQTSADKRLLLSGDNHFGKERRKRSMRRAIGLILLGSIAILLVGVLVWLATR